MHKSSLSKHQIELSIQSSPSFLNCAGVYQASHGAVDFSQIGPGYYGWRLVVDANLKSCGTPIYKSDGLSILDFSDGWIDILGRYISTVQQADRHVFACTRVTLDHLVFGLKAILCYFCYANLFVVCLCNNREMTSMRFAYHVYKVFVPKKNSLPCQQRW